MMPSATRRRGSVRRRSSIALVIASMVLGLISVLTTHSPPRAEAADAAGWQAGYIISDANFYNGNAMSVAGVQDFLNQKGANCADGEMPCLKRYATATPATAYEAGLCNALPATGSSSAAQIIDMVARACGISQKVLLVTLNKESGLVTRTQPTLRNYQTAMGYACPDTAPCDAQFYGLFNQIYQAARKWKYYTANPTRYNYQAGRYNSIYYNPNFGCGSSSVYIQNQATANLYIYTPYQPNTAALSNMYGTGDDCSAYGNRNFWRYYTDWFGDPRGGWNAPVGNTEAATFSGGAMRVTGWALDPDMLNKSIPVAVYRDGVGISWFPTDQPRSDVNAAYAATGTHGFSITLTGEPSGTHQYCVFAIDNEGTSGNPLIGCVSGTVPVATAPVGSVEAITASGNAVSVIGWTIDPDSVGASSKVTVLRNGTPVGTYETTAPRSDVNTAFGSAGKHGFVITLPEEPSGRTTYCVRADDNEGILPSREIGCATIAVNPTAAPYGVIDAASAADQVVRLAGWVVDPDSPDVSATVAVTRDGATVGTFATDQMRADVNGATGATGSHGFDLSLPGQNPGTATYCVYALDNEAKVARSALGCSTLTISIVKKTPPYGLVDGFTAANGVVRAQGWMIDPDSPSSSGQVSVYRNGTRVGNYPLSALRPDVNTALGISGEHGYDISLPNQPPGKAEYCVSALDNEGVVGETVLGCSTVDVLAPTGSSPVGNLEAGSARYQTVSLVGWSVDLDSPASSGLVAVYRSGTGLGWFSQKILRADVNGAYAASGNHGFSLSLPNEPVGTYSYCVFAIDNEGVAQNPLIGCQTVTTTPTPATPPVGMVDAVKATGRSVRVQGWALDPDSMSDGPNKVAIYRNGVGLGWYSSTVLRTDVNAAYGTSGQHGFDVELTGEPTGNNTYCMYAIDNEAVTVNPLIGCQTVAVSMPTEPPFGALDAVLVAGTQVTVYGWLLDTDSSGTPGTVRIVRDGAVVGDYATTITRTDVNEGFGVDGAHGFAVPLASQSAGTHQYCAYAFDNEGVTANVLLGCSTVTV